MVWGVNKGRMEEFCIGQRGMMGREGGEGEKAGGKRWTLLLYVCVGLHERHDCIVYKSEK